MATVRLFANLREMAGASRLETDAVSVGAALDELVGRYGQDFEGGLQRSRIWVNGDPADRSDALSEEDELAIIPPVSGGAIAVSRPTIWDWVIPLAVAGVLIYAALSLSEAWFASLLVGGVGLWAFDLAEQAEERGRAFPLAPVLAAIVVGALAPFTSITSGRALEGTGLSLVFGIIALLVWAVIVAEDRNVVGVASTLLVLVLAGVSVASLVVVRLSDAGADRVAGFLVVMIVAGAAGGLASRLPGQFLDAYSASAVAALAASVLAAWIWGLGVADFFVVGVVLAVAVVAGRGLGSLMRVGDEYGPERPRGWMAFADGAVVAAAIFLPILRAVT